MGWLFQDGCFLQARPQGPAASVNLSCGEQKVRKIKPTARPDGHIKNSDWGIQGENNSFSKEAGSLCDQTHGKQNRNIRLEITMAVKRRYIGAFSNAVSKHSLSCKK